MKTILLFLAFIMPACTWTKDDFKRIGTKVLDISLMTAANEAQAIQVEKQSGK